jgi:serine/threonine protein phosphatase PrpC
MPLWHAWEDAQMIKLCQDCHYENGPHARFCASCGRALRKESPGAVAQQALDEAAQAVDEMLQSPVIRDFAVKAGEVAQQTSAQFERVAKSDGVQRTLQKLSSLPGQAAKALQESRKPVAESALPASAARQMPCPRCAALNRQDVRFCAACGVMVQRPAMAIQCVTAYLSDAGQVRSNNEDTVRVWSFVAHGLSAWGLLIADGMGGAASGEVASQCVAEVVQQDLAARIQAVNPTAQDVERWLRVILRQANGAVYRRSQVDPALHGMGSTATLAWLEGDWATVAHVGDSRAYLIPPAGPFWQITQDHTMVALLAAIGEMTAEEAEASPQNNLLYKAIGVAPKVEIDTYVRRLEVGDRLLLCSDGLTRHVPAGEMAAIVRQHADPAAACQALVALANQRGGEDNISVIVSLAQPAPRDSGA